MATKQQGNQSTRHRSPGEKGGDSRLTAGTRSGKKLQGRTKSSSSRSASSPTKVETDSRASKSGARVVAQSKSERKSRTAVRKASSSSAIAPKRSLGSRIRDVAKTLVAKVRPAKHQEASGLREASSAVASSTTRESRPAPRRTTRVAPTVHRDDEFTPSQRSAKAPFDRSRAEKPRDRESDLMIGMADERFNEEDRYTNKSGDPRIGTHGRTYEQEEERK